MTTMTTVTKPVKNDSLVLRAARGERTERTPVWLMRQAGRCDPAYRAIRRRCGLPLEEMFRRPELAAEITLLPRRLGVDALILFQDILTPLAPLGAPFVFRPGPVLDAPVRTKARMETLRRYDPAEELPFVATSIRFVRNALAGALPLLGFAGAPFTLAAFLIEGGSAVRRLPHTRRLMGRDPALVHRLLRLLTEVTTAYLRRQIDAGVDAVQLFDSMAGHLTPDEYDEFAQPYQAEIFSALAGTVPRILFAREHRRLDVMMETGADVLSIGAGIDLAAARRRVGGGAALQGNVDNRLVADGTPAEIDAAAAACVRAGGHHGHILNLGHGLLERTPLDNVRRLIDTCRITRAAGAEEDRP